MLIVILCGIYLVELMCYRLGLRILFDVRLKMNKWMLAGLAFPVLIGCLPIAAAGKYVLVTVSVIAITFILYKDKSVEKMIRIAMVFLLMLCLDGVLEGMLQSGGYLNETGNVYANMKYCLGKCGTFMCMVAFLQIKKRNVMKELRYIKSYIYLLLGSIVIAMMLCLATLKYTRGYVNNKNFWRYSSVLEAIIPICILLLILFIIYIKNTNEAMERLLKTEKILKEAQVSYYKQMLEKENDTRKYRHDMTNHLIYVQDSLGRGKIEDTRSYISHILGGFKKIQNTYYVIGNEMVDVIMNYFFGMLPKSVEISIGGKCPVELDVPETDVCTIFSNLFQNAVEEITRNYMTDAKIMVGVEKGRQYAEYTIKNSIYGQIKTMNKQGFPKSNKTDKENHGIGMANVKTAIERNGGRFSWEQKDGFFCVKVILPIKNEPFRE